MHPVRSRPLENQRSAFRLLVSTTDHELAFKHDVVLDASGKDDIPQLKMFTAF